MAAPSRADVAAPRASAAAGGQALAPGDGSQRIQSNASPRSRGSWGPGRNVGVTARVTSNGSPAVEAGTVNETVASASATVVAKISAPAVTRTAAGPADGGRQLMTRAPQTHATRRSAPGSTSRAAAPLQAKVS